MMLAKAGKKMTDSFRQVHVSLLLCFLLAPPALAQAGDADDIRPKAYRSYSDLSVVETGKSGVREIVVNYPSQAQSLVNMLKSMMMTKHHKATFKQVGKKLTIHDTTDNRTWIINTRNDSEKKIDTKGLEVICALYPKNFGIPFYVSRVFERQKQYGKALEYYRKGCEILDAQVRLDSVPVTNLSRSMQAANCAYFEGMMGRYESAARDFTKAIEFRPDYKVNYINRAQCYRKLHKADLASADEQKAKELAAPKPVLDRAKLQPLYEAADAVMLTRADAFEVGLDIANKLLAKDPKSNIALLARARALVKLGQYNQALTAFRKVQFVEKAKAEFQREISSVEKLAKLGPPPYGDLKVLKAGPSRSFLMIQNGKRVTVTVEKIAADHKGDYRVYEAVSSAQKRAGNTQALDEELSKMILVSPEDMGVIANKIETSQALRHWPDAEKYCNRYLDLLSDGSSEEFNLDFLQYVYSIRALARRAQNNYNAAIEDETTLLKIEPDSAEVYCDRADCYMKAGKYALAVEDYTKSIQFDDSKTGGNYERRAKAYDKLNKGDLAKADRETAKRLSGTKAVRPD